jgi:hypothetical protein
MDAITRFALSQKFDAPTLDALELILPSVSNSDVAAELLLGIYIPKDIPNTALTSEGPSTLLDYNPVSDRVNYSYMSRDDVKVYFHEDDGTVRGKREYEDLLEMIENKTISLDYDEAEKLWGSKKDYVWKRVGKVSTRVSSTSLEYWMRYHKKFVNK